MAAPLRQIIGMGGGGFSDEPRNLALDRYIVDQARRRRPRVCFVPTASGDAEGYIAGFYKAFRTLRCSPTHLSLFKLPTADLTSYVLAQDVIYVGGGNTKSLLTLWREWKLDRIFRQAWRECVILSGLSAGSICWFAEGVTDSIPGELSTLPCLGFLPGSNCPHYDSQPQRRPAYRRLIRDGKISPGYAADDGVALHFLGTRLARVVSSRPRARAFHLHRNRGRAVETPINPVRLLRG